MIQEVNISPIHYSELNQYLVSEHLNYAIILMVVGFLTIFILEKLGAQKND
jgi:putative membrane protein